MALEKSIQTNYGVNAAYHKINTITISWHNRACFVDFFSYLDRQAREDNRNPLSSAYYEFTEDDFTFDVESNISQQIYDKLKLRKEWQDATDC